HHHPSSSPPPPSIITTTTTTFHHHHHHHLPPPSIITTTTIHHHHHHHHHHHLPSSPPPPPPSIIITTTTTHHHHHHHPSSSPPPPPPSIITTTTHHHHHHHHHLPPPSIITTITTTTTFHHHHHHHPSSSSPPPIIIITTTHHHHHHHHPSSSPPPPSIIITTTTTTTPFASHGPCRRVRFAKIKYILNGLSAGHDVMFLDADIIMLRDPLPYFYDHGADIYAMMEKCLLFNDTVSIAAFEYVRHQKLTPPLNIGALFFKATPGVTRCVYNWIWDMYGQVAFRPHVWDQDIFGVLMPKCSYKFDLRLQVLDPRLFQSACYPRCGCMYHDANVTSATLGMSAAGVPPVTGHLCDPGLWGSWLLRHFPCSGTTDQKAWHMRQFAEGLVHGQPVHITKHWAIEKKQGKGDLEGQEEVAEDDAGMSSAENVRL
ncbi:hypothetical protein Vretifemale_8542, partial [Volvox reticuliferus]